MEESRLLINEPPLVVQPSLAGLIGVEKAIILQQVHYWLQTSRHEHEGHRWVYNTYEEWGAQFPWAAIRTIRRHIAGLEASGLLVSGCFNRSPMDHTRWYRIDYDRLNDLPKVVNRCGQNVHIDVDKMSISNQRLSIPKTIYRTELAAIGGDQPLLEQIQSLPYWGRADDDPAWLEEFQAEYPELTAQGVKECRDYWDGRRAGNKGIWKNRLRNWYKKAREFSERKAAQGADTERIRTSIPGKRKPGYVPSAEELARQEDRLKAGLKPVEGGRFG